MSKQIKVLLCGDVEGNFNTLFKRVENINNKSGPFDVLFCVGNFFHCKDNKELLPYKTGAKKVPILTYILGPNNEDSSKFYSDGDEEICRDVYYLGKRGLYTSSGGLKIAYVSGMACESNTEQKWNFNTEDLKSVRDVCFRSSSNFRGIDILLTSQWPAKVTKHQTLKFASHHVSWLALHLKPRYHISSLEGIYYERPPYRISNATELEIVTRFIGLAKVGNASKEKWIHALSLTPLDQMSITQLIQKTIDETPCPYNTNELEATVFGSKKRVQLVESERQYFYDMDSPLEVARTKRNKKQKIEFDQSKCWFCLASPSVEKQLIVSVGDFMYLTLAKGGIVDEHFLICPIEHCQHSLGLSEEMLQELMKFKKAVRQFYKRNQQVPVFYERNYKTSHMQIQCVPIPKSAERNLLNEFQNQAELHDLVLKEELNEALPSGNLFFNVELPSGENYFININASTGFPVNFGRQVLASRSILNKPDRVEWKECVLNKEDEEMLMKKIRTDFKTYDFTE